MPTEVARLGKNCPPELSPEQRAIGGAIGARASALHRTVDILLREGTIWRVEHDVLLLGIHERLFDLVTTGVEELEDRDPHFIDGFADQPRRPRSLSKLRDELRDRAVLPIAPPARPGPKQKATASPESVRRRLGRSWKNDPGHVQLDERARRYAEERNVPYRIALLAVSRRDA